MSKYEEYGSDAFCITQGEFEQLKRQVDEYLDKLRRAHADFVNYQERMKREKESLTKFAVEGLILELLPFLDALHKSAEALSNAKEAANVVDGIKLVEKELMKTLAKNGVKPIDVKGVMFNPLYHEAVAEVEANDHPDKTIIEEVRRGYIIHDRVLRPSQVKVAKRQIKNAK